MMGRTLSAGRTRLCVTPRTTSCRPGDASALDPAHRTPPVPAAAKSAAPPSPVRGADPVTDTPEMVPELGNHRKLRSRRLATRLIHQACTAVIPTAPIAIPYAIGRAPSQPDAPAPRRIRAI